MPNAHFLPSGFKGKRPILGAGGNAYLNVEVKAIWVEAHKLPLEHKTFDEEKKLEEPMEEKLVNEAPVPVEDAALTGAKEAVEEAPVDEAVEDEGIVLGFMKSLTDPTEVHFKFTKQPLGLSFEHARMPMATIKVPGGQAEKLGVQDNMILV